jgi:hypothetical protein
MERNNSTKWINSLKIALINNDLQKIEEYSNRELPSFSSIDEAKEALTLINQAKDILKEKQTIISKQLQALKQNKKYFQNNTSSIMNLKA